MRPEDTIQAAIVDYLRAVLPPMYRVSAIPNAARRTASSRASNAVPGLYPGVADLQIIGPGGYVWVAEIKTAKGVLSDAQKDWRDWYGQNYVPYAIWRSIDDCRASLKEWKLETREAA